MDSSDMSSVPSDAELDDPPSLQTTLMGTQAANPTKTNVSRKKYVSAYNAELPPLPGDPACFYEEEVEVDSRKRSPPLTLHGGRTLNSEDRAVSISPTKPMREKNVKQEKVGITVAVASPLHRRIAKLIKGNSPTTTIAKLVDVQESSYVAIRVRAPFISVVLNRQFVKNRYRVDYGIVEPVY